MGLRVGRAITAVPTLMLGAFTTLVTMLRAVEDAALSPSVVEVSSTLVVIVDGDRVRRTAAVLPNCPAASLCTPAVGLGANVSDATSLPSIVEVSSADVVVLLSSNQGRTATGHPCCVVLSSQSPVAGLGAG